MGLKKVAACLKRQNKFVITSHINLEGDALGSELAFYYLVKKLGKDAVIVNEDRLPYGYHFLSGSDKVKKFKKNFKNIKFDCLAVLDCSGLSRCGVVSTLRQSDHFILNIDHHISNEWYGDINWVEPGSSSTAEMIYKLYQSLNVPLDKKSALALYTGILTDTGSFRYPNTSSFTHQAAAELVKFGLNIPQIYKNIYENVPLQDMRLLVQILPQMQYLSEGKVIWFQVRRKVLQAHKLSIDLTEHILSFGRSIKDAEVVVLFKENLGVKDEIRVNFRSQGQVDVNKVASFFGGGGHRTASGVTIKGKIDTVRKKVLAKIKENLK